MNKIILPYSNIKEFAKAFNQHGPHVCRKNSIYTTYQSLEIKKFNPSKFVINLYDGCSSKQISYTELATNYIWQDNTPCGNESMDSM